MTDHTAANRAALVASLQQSGYDMTEQRAIDLVDAAIERPQNHADRKWPMWAIDQLAEQIARSLSWPKA